MGVYIKGMEMPTSCDECPLYTCMHNHDDCPLAPVPPHGDLIDRDAAAKKIWDDMRFPSNLANAQFFVNELREMPTIIPAEEGET